MDLKRNKIKHKFKKLSDALIMKICADLKRGSTFQYAADANGYSYDVFKMWRRQGRLDLDAGLDTLPARLVTAVGQVVQECVISCYDDIRFSPKGHLGAQWVLERYHMSQFSNDAGIRELKRLLDESLDDIKESLKSQNGAKIDPLADNGLS